MNWTQESTQLNLIFFRDRALLRSSLDMVMCLHKLEISFKKMWLFFKNENALTFLFFKVMCSEFQNFFVSSWNVDFRCLLCSGRPWGWYSITVYGKRKATGKKPPMKIWGLRIYQVVKQSWRNTIIESCPNSSIFWVTKKFFFNEIHKNSWWVWIGITTY